MRFTYLGFFVFLPVLVFCQDEYGMISSQVYSFEAKEIPANKRRTSQRFFEGKTTHLSYLEMHSTTLAPGVQSHPPHKHDEEEIVIVKEGVLQVTIGEDVRELHPQSIALIHSGAEHGFRNAGDEEVIYYVMRYASNEGLDMRRGEESGGSKYVAYEQLPYRVHQKGGRRDYFDHPTSMCKDFEMHMTNLKPGLSSHPPHTHVVEEIILITQGEVRMHIDGKEFSCKAGDVIFLDSMVSHAPTNIGDVECQYFAYQWK